MSSQMAAEIMEIPTGVARQIKEVGPRYREIGEHLRSLNVKSAISNARGSSDHAATYLKYLLELLVGLPLASVGPSIASVYGRRLRLEGQLCITISQSGASKDLCMLQEAAAEAGAVTLALVNDVSSPAAVNAALLAPLHAGPELSVAATKTFIASQVAAATIVSAMCGDGGLLSAVEQLPDALEAALAKDWDHAIEIVAAAPSVFTISRGPGLSIAAEAALKFKETCRIHAEAYSAAELKHGPIALAGPRFVAILFVSRDEARASILEAESALREIGAQVLLCDPASGGALPAAPAPHPLLDPICQAASFYKFVEKVARERGLHPDRPPHLSKVTVTV